MIEIRRVRSNACLLSHDTPQLSVKPVVWRYFFPLSRSFVVVRGESWCLLRSWIIHQSNISPLIFKSLFKMRAISTEKSLEDTMRKSAQHRAKKPKNLCNLFPLYKACSMFHVHRYADSVAGRIKCSQVFDRTCLTPPLPIPSSYVLSRGSTSSIRNVFQDKSIAPPPVFFLCGSINPGSLFGLINTLEWRLCSNSQLRHRRRVFDWICFILCYQPLYIFIRCLCCFSWPFFLLSFFFCALA